MNSELLRFGWELGLVAANALTLIFMIGIVWRVERELDAAYKCFAAAVFFFLIMQITDLLPQAPPWLLSGSKTLTVLALFLGAFFMRDLVRRLDGEKR
jgi:hypothetical protein